MQSTDKNICNSMKQKKSVAVAIITESFVKTKKNLLIKILLNMGV